LESIKTAQVSFDYEIIVVDSEVEDETQDMIREIFLELQAKYISFEKNKGYSKLVNAGLVAARGQYVLVLNADMIMFKDSLQKMFDYMEKNPPVGLLGPQLLNFNETIQDSCFRHYRILTILCRRTFIGKLKFGQKELARFLMKDFDHKSVREVDWILGAALMIRRQALEQVGQMDERFFMYFEDTDWCRRFWSRGWQVVYYPDAKMYHYHGRVSKKTGGLLDLFVNKYAWIHITSAIKYFFKYRLKDKFDKS
jgi:GT2 family glycosyltransferase